MKLVSKKYNLGTGMEVTVMVLVPVLNILNDTQPSHIVFKKSTCQDLSKPTILTNVKHYFETELVI